MTRSIPEISQQLLPAEAYKTQEWLDREERDLFGKCWTFAGTVHDFQETGDYRTVRAGPHTLIVLRDAEGQLKGFHNLCRHRGTELVEDCGNVGKSIVCPYHNWVYNLDGSLRGAPDQRACFPQIQKGEISLFHAAVGVFRDLVFVHPESEPDEPFEVWIDDLASVPWPHDISPDGLKEASEPLIYEMECNWKIFAENALDGYHLAYLHKNTLGGPTHDKNLWEAFGQHLVWWSTEREGVKHRVPKFVEDAARNSWMKTVHSENQAGYGGVYLLFPTTLLTPNPWGFSVSIMEPLSPTKTLLTVRNWATRGLLQYDTKPKDVPGFDPASGRIKSSLWDKHPLETGDFQTEDIWVCEKMQRAMRSPQYEVGPLARGAGGEAALGYFQRCVLNYLDPERAGADP